MAIGDSELVAATLAGDRTAFGELIVRHRPRTRAVVRRLLSEPDDAEDVTQEAVLQAYLGLESLRAPERFGSWLTGIAVNLAKMRLRRIRGFPLLQTQEHVPAPEQVFDTAELLHLVQEAVSDLPAGERDAVLMHYVDGLSCQEIAELLGLSAGAIRVRLHRARSRLREHLAPLQPAREEIEMVEVEIEDVLTRVDEPAEEGALPRLAWGRLRVVLLRERDGERVMPIWIGANEGDALGLQLAGEAMPRPLTADLTARIVAATGARVERVAVASLHDRTFYAVVTVTGATGRRELDARPSDALNLAARVGAPVFVDRAVFDQNSRRSGELPTWLDEEETALGVGREGEWHKVTPALVRALYELPSEETEA